MVKDQGFDHETIEVECPDGCILQMERITNKESYDVVYFQHGFMDSNLSWVIHGQGESIAFSARESGVSGHDVFAGNLRGINPIKFNEKMMDE